MERTEVGRGDDPLIGRVLDGRYRVGARVARGGMATVYQAEDLRLERTVAVKIMHSGLGDDPEFVARFEREARSAARLSHHNVVSVFDQGDDHGTLFLVMEYVPGTTLRDVIRAEAPMDPGKALEIIEPVLAALAAAHGAGMIHRDIKPENVLLSTDEDSGAGRVKVADFGLARAVNAETQHTATGGVLIGTVSYLSPELVVDGKADARSDVYAVGVLMYEMLTGVKPHQADTPIQIAYKHVHEDIPAPSARVPGLPAYVDALVARATARDRDLRPSDARVLLHQVRRVRQALDHGVVDDPELTADLLPNAPRTESTGELPFGDDEVHDHDTELTTPVPSVPVTPVRSAPVAAPLRQTPPQRPLPPPPVVAAEPRPPRRPRRSRRGLYLLIGVLVVALLVGIGAWDLGRGTTTPAVINLTEAAAKARIVKAGLTFKVGDPAYSETIAKGSVIRTDPAQGARISKHGTVTAVISLGPERHSVPSGRGKTLEQMQSLLTAASLTVGTVTQRYNPTVPEGMVVTTDPPASTPLKRGTAVDVIISRGPRPITIPDFTGKSGAKANTKLTKLGFKVDVEKDFSDTVAKGTVISQTPNAGTGFKGDPITIVVSQGPELIEIPKVKGSNADDATAALQALGFVVEVVHNGLFVGANVVVGSNPAAGTMAPKGSTVILSIV
ncbi:MAG: protein kinase [Marmoricola sp.]|nr:protein kinase [Marmoricola sp.]